MPILNKRVWRSAPFTTYNIWNCWYRDSYFDERKKSPENPSGEMRNMASPHRDIFRRHTLSLLRPTVPSITSKSFISELPSNLVDIFPLSFFLKLLSTPFLLLLWEGHVWAEFKVLDPFPSGEVASPDHEHLILSKCSNSFSFYFGPLILYYNHIAAMANLETPTPSPFPSPSESPFSLSERSISTYAAKNPTIALHMLILFS